MPSLYCDEGSPRFLLPLILVCKSLCQSLVHLSWPYSLALLLPCSFAPSGYPSETLPQSTFERTPATPDASHHTHILCDSNAQSLSRNLWGWIQLVLCMPLQCNQLSSTDVCRLTLSTAPSQHWHTDRSFLSCSQVLLTRAIYED